MTPRTNTCQVCGRSFTQPAGRGRPRKRCTDCSPSRKYTRRDYPVTDGTAPPPPPVPPPSPGRRLQAIRRLPRPLPGMPDLLVHPGYTPADD